MLADVQITIIPKYHATYGCRPLPTVELQFVCQDFTVTTRIANVQKKGGGGGYIRRIHGCHQTTGFTSPHSTVCIGYSVGL